MKFSTREDVAVPVDFLFAALSDFDYFERAALRRGAEVQRIDKLKTPGPGMQWQTSFKLRGKQRDVELTLKEFDPPNWMFLASQSAALEGAGKIDLMALSRNRTRLSIEIETKPRTISARLLEQSMKLARTRLTQQFRDRVAEFAAGVETRYQKKA
ncbi:SRPBCC family protein [Roseovarius salinarum]|uniref:SRPBCC family protein n=1 Tax=Roseovarius salinarum TaxID=1981892 RepID=UPI000C34D011|nr:SRPBCC family protein [Roseovarius salinarum]